MTSSGHKAHMAVHQQGKRFMCELCGKTFTQKVNMQQHFKGHSGEKPYQCDICGKG
jgi:KRAB domain-containing zinc finger protein